MKQSDYSRNRKLTFPVTTLFIMNFLTKSLSIEIENFLSYMKRGLKEFRLETFTKSAFCQGRKKINPAVFKKLNSAFIDDYYTDNDLGVKRWKGFRLLSVDGSYLDIPQTKELRAHFGEQKNQTTTGVARARVSVIYDVLNRYVLDGSISPIKIGEREMALGHLTICDKGDLNIYDRGYPSYAFIYEHLERNLDFLIRAKVTYSSVTRDFISSNAKSMVVDMFPGKNTKVSDKAYDRNTPIRLRLIRIDLPSGEVELLLTSLVNTKKYPHKIFMELYAKRWGVETFYDELKNKLKVEHFSGYSLQSILQDFYAALFVSNIQTMIVTELEDEIHEKTKLRKLKYKVNANLSYGYLKNRIVKLFFTQRDASKISTELKELFMNHLVPIRPNRKEDRQPNKYRKRKRPKTLTNHKPAF